MRRCFISLALTGAFVAAAASAQTAPYVRTAIVSPTPGNDLASGTTLINTLAGLTPAPSSTNKWLVKIEPGIYNTGTTTLPMRSWVDIEGSGVLQTTIRGTVGPTLASPNFDEVLVARTSASLNQGVVRGADNAEIRQLTIECVSTAQQPSCMGMINESVSPRIIDVRIRAVTPLTGGSRWGMRNYYASPYLDNVDIKVGNATDGDNYGIVNVGGAVKYVPIIRNSEILASGSGFRNVGILNRGWTAVNPMTNTRVTAMNGSYSYGIWHTESYSDVNAYYIENCRVWASLASVASVGIKQDEFEPTVHPTVRDSRVIGDTHGIEISSYSQIEVVNSHVNGATYAVSGGTVKLGATWIQRGTINGVTETCAGVWDNAFTFYASTCP